MFRHPTLSATEMQNGCKLGLDSWADTSCSGRHCHVMEFVEGKTVPAKGFANHLPSTPDLPIANVAYAYDAPTGEIFILVVNNSIYMGEKMEDSYGPHRLVRASFLRFWEQKSQGLLTKNSKVF